MGFKAMLREIGLLGCVALAHATHNGTASDSHDSYERLPAVAVLAVLGFPLIFGAVCLTAFLHGCFKKSYKGWDQYSEHENEGVFVVNFKEQILGLQMRMGLIVNVSEKTHQLYDVSEGDRIWRIEDQLA